ncbi:MAG TPA: cytochrome c oxidase assembly protein [Stellaceae bacterium]
MWHGNAVPYCGVPPIPAELLSRWNLDPVLIAVLLAAAVFYISFSPRVTKREPWQKAAFVGGWALAALALVSPLCPLSVSLFAARIGQHMILTLVAAPLVAAGGLLAVLAAAVRQSSPRWLRPAPLSATAVFAAFLWFWHAPAPYAATFASTPVYWAMHLSLFGSAIWLWHGLFDDRGPFLARLAAGVVTSAQMGLLGALITLAPRPLYAPHALTTAVWGLTPLQDQELGGGIMWVPGCLLILALSLVPLWPLLADPAPHRAGG